MLPTTIFLQAAAGTGAAETGGLSLFALLAKGGWVMIPLLILFAVLLFTATDSWISMRRMNKADRTWFPGVMALLREGNYDQVLNMAQRSDSSLSGIVRAAVQGRDLPQKQLEEDIQIEARATIARAERPIGYLGMIASIAPMLGFLGTIFGVITIFMNISATNELSISSISDGLYQKMLCSGVGLLEGILAYCAYWWLGRRVDAMVLRMDRAANILLKTLTPQGR